MGINGVEEMVRCMVSETMQLRALARRAEQAAKQASISLGFPLDLNIKTWEWEATKRWKAFNTSGR